MIIVSTDMILARALAVIAEETGFSEVKICSDRAVPEKFEFAIIDADSTDMRISAENMLTISADKNKGTDILCPFSENDIKNTLLHVFNGDSADLRPTKSTKYLAVIQNTLRFGETSIKLTPNELTVFKLLYEKENRCVLSDDIVNALDASGKSEHFLTVYISGLRKKLISLFGFNILCSVRGKGYVLQTNKLKVNND